MSVWLSDKTVAVTSITMALARFKRSESLRQLRLVIDIDLFSLQGEEVAWAIPLLPIFSNPWLVCSQDPPSIVGHPPYWIGYDAFLTFRVLICFQMNTYVSHSSRL